jgi:hypothetical protein
VAPQGQPVADSLPTTVFLPGSRPRAGLASKRSAKPSRHGQQAEAERRAAVQTNLIAPYDTCVRRSAAEQLRINPDRNLAVENAFIACTTEEGRIRSYYSLTGAFPAVVDAAIFRRRAMLKQSIVGP